MHAEVDLLHQRLHVGSVHDLVGELREACLAFEQQNRHAELHAELCLQLGARPMMDQRVRHVVISPHRHALHALGTQNVALDKIEHDGHAGVRERAARMRLD